MTRYVAVIGTAGRDPKQPMDRGLWLAMIDDVLHRLSRTDILVSGGAAWADHLAVHAFLSGAARGLELYLPAPMVEERFQGAGRTSGGVVNYYHDRFTKTAGIDGLKEIVRAIEAGAVVHAEPVTHGFGGLFARNAKVAARATHVLAYTFSEGDVPAAGGTKDTWDKAGNADRKHVPLNDLVGRMVSRETGHDNLAPARLSFGERLRMRSNA